MKSVLTISDLQAFASGAEVVLAAGTAVTPLARDDAAERGIRLREDVAWTSTNETAAAISPVVPLIVAEPPAPAATADSADEVIRAVTVAVIAYLSRSSRPPLGEPTGERHGRPAHRAVDAVAALIDHTL